ncbi:MAG: hypothetical protein ABI721_00640 [Candidatus Dojkabacteria bacterium]
MFDFIAAWKSGFKGKNAITNLIVFVLVDPFFILVDSIFAFLIFKIYYNIAPLGSIGFASKFYSPFGFHFQLNTPTQISDVVTFWNASTINAVFVIVLITSLLLIILLSALIKGWYFYENFKSSYFKTDSMLVFKESPYKVLTKNIKMLIIRLFYYIVPIIISLCLIIALGTYSAYLLQGEGQLNNVYVLSLVLGFLFVLYFVFLFFETMVVSTGIYKLIKENSIKPALNIVSVVGYSLRKFFPLLLLFILNVIVILFSRFLNNFNFILVVGLIVSTLNGYYMNFVYPHMLGSLYRHADNKKVKK